MGIPCLSLDLNGNDQYSAKESEPTATSINGTTANTKAGAIVLTEDQRAIYILGLNSWPEEKLGQTITITGFLEQTKGHVPATTTNNSGEITQGVSKSDMHLTLRDASW